MKRVLSLTLALLLLLSTMAMTLVSCGEEEETKKENDKANDAVLEVQEGDIFAERAAISDDLGDYDFGGRKFRSVYKFCVSIR